MLRYREYRPCPALRPHVRCYWSMLGGGREQHRVLPDGCLDIVFTERTPADCRLVAVGAMSSYLDVDAAPVTIGVRFLPGHGGLLLGISAAALTDQQIDVGEVWGADAPRLLERLARAPSVAERIALVDAALRRRLARVGAVDTAVTCMLERIVASSGGARERDVVAGIGLSPRHLRRRFKESVGLLPKQFARIVRFRRVVDGLLPAPTPTWADAALAAGFYDQAHLIHDFKALSGRTPAEYAAAHGRFLQDRPSPPA